MSKKIGRALVVGAGISGIRAALDLAETGYGVTLIDRAPHIGGILSQLDDQFPTNHCGMCRMLPLVKRDAASQFCLRKGLFHDNIHILLNTEIADIQGEPGHFTVSLKEKPTWVDPDLCIGCGICTSACPVEVPDAFNAGLTLRKAIYLAVPHNIPNPYVIDSAACTRCGACEAVCPTHAVRLAEDLRKQFRVLVVDDERIVRDSLKDWLEDEGFSVDAAESGSAALDRLGTEAFNLMLTDVKMPGMDGVQLLKQAKEMQPDLSVLMMTAYATVDTAVEAMKIGALDYLVKPFDPETMIPKVVKVYEELEATRRRQLEVGAIVLCGGTDYFNPADPKNVHGYGVQPNVITSLELERMLSGTGPGQGGLVRPHDGRSVRKIAWLQCVGSRDIQNDADFCSSICCMVAIKEALLAKDRVGDPLEAAIFYMDMRTFGKSFERYRQRAEADRGIRFERSRVHSVLSDRETGDPLIRYVRADGSCLEEVFDLVVLAVGQRPSSGTEALARLADVDLNPWGFVRTHPFAPYRTSRPGILVGGSYSGLRDIGESVITASAAAGEASRILHAAGGSLADESVEEQPYRDVAREPPKVVVVICSCGDGMGVVFGSDPVVETLKMDPDVDRVVFFEHLCTASGWGRLAEVLMESRPNRILIGACHPYLYSRKLKELGRQINLDPCLMDVVDLLSPALWPEPGHGPRDPKSPGRERMFDLQLSALKMAASRLKHLDPRPVPEVPVVRGALVVGGGISGMTAALTVADHGYPVDLVEREEALGGHLHWIGQTLDGDLTGPLLEETVQKVEKHPLIQVHLGARVVGSHGQVGRFFSTLENRRKTVENLEHGVIILSTGGREAQTTSYGYGTSDAILTQRELQLRLNQGSIKPKQMGCVVMIQCVGSREEPRNYCSRVCCGTSLKHARMLMELNPDMGIYILYRDLMTYGFTESHYTAARKAGVVFIQYDVNRKPTVQVPEEPNAPVTVTALDPVLGRPIQIQADLLVLATGMVPAVPAELKEHGGIATDPDGFFAEAESKWRPVDALKEGVFACGTALAPRSIPESMATAVAAAQRSLRILTHDRLPSGRVVAAVRHSLCSLCERCIQTCPYEARSLDLDREQVRVNPAMCQGCGACSAICPNGAAVVFGFGEDQMLDVIDAALEGALRLP